MRDEGLAIRKRKKIGIRERRKVAKNDAIKA